MQSLKFKYSSPQELRYLQLSYFCSYAILNWVQKKIELSYFSPIYAISLPQLYCFLLSPPSYATPSGKNSVTEGEKEENSLTRIFLDPIQSSIAAKIA